MPELTLGQRLLLQSIPAASTLLAHPDAVVACAEYGEALLRALAGALILERRAAILRAEITTAAALLPDILVPQLLQRARRHADPAARAVINATGVLLPAALGRAPLSEDALTMLQAAAGYTPLPPAGDFDAPSPREGLAQTLLRELTGCEAALILNNNAGAYALALRCLCAGREAVVARGQLGEIGANLRMPELIATSGAILREAGTVNRTGITDYEAAITAQTGALLWIHPASYQVSGFTSQASIQQIAQLAARHALPVLADLGLGALRPLAEYGLPDEPLVPDAIAAGCAVVAFSGDKLLCGPQCGILCGTRDAIEAIRRDPFFRYLRVDKLRLAALEATLLVWLNGEERTRLPLYRSLSRSRKELLDAAAAAAETAREFFEVEARICESTVSLLAGGVPSALSVAVRLDLKAGNIHRLAQLLREEGIYPYLQDGALLLQILSVPHEQTGLLCERLHTALERLTAERPDADTPPEAVDTANASDSPEASSPETTPPSQTPVQSQE